VVKAVLFDVDNTLIDFAVMKEKCCEAAIDAMISAGLRMNREKALEILYKLYEKYGIEYQRIFQRFLENADKKIDYRIMAHGIIAYRKVKENYLVPYPNTVRTLLKLKKKYKLGVISDAPRIQAWLRLVAIGLDNVFDEVITAADVRRQKTHSAPFIAALRKLNVKPEEAMMVGDRVSRDIVTAKKLGMQTCFARYGAKAYGNEGDSGGADFEIDDIKEVLEIL